MSRPAPTSCSRPRAGPTPGWPGGRGRRTCSPAARLTPPAPALRRLAVAGLLYDIGKLRIAPEILNKPGQLSDDEYRRIKTHPQAGANILARVGGFDEEIPIVLAHHERVDGGGYPHGLAGDRIPLEAR